MISALGNAEKQIFLTQAYFVPDSQLLKALAGAARRGVDGVWASVGSSNLDWRSFLDNDEVNAVVLGREFAGQMQAAFARDLKPSEPIDPKTWERRSPMLRIKEWLARLVERFL